MKLHLSDLKWREYWTKTRRGVLYGAYLLLFLLLQNVIFSHIAPFGVRAMFMPALVVAVALFEGGYRGGLFALAAGVVCDLYFAGQGVLFTVLFPVIAFAVGFLTDFFLNRRFFSYAVMAAAALFLSAFAQMFPLLVYYDQGSWTLWGAAILQTLWSVPFIWPAYYMCKIFPWRAEGAAPSPY